MVIPADGGELLRVNVILSVSVHPLPSVAVTVYVPADVILLLYVPVTPLFHEYEVPPEALKFK